MSRFTLLPLLLLVLLGLGLTVPQTTHALAHTPTTVDRRSLAFAHPRRDAAVFNPVMKRTQPLEMEMTNGERMKRGMGPKKPHWKRQGALRPRASPVPGAQQQQGCTPRTGVLRVGDQGFLSRAANPFGEYLVTRDRADALTVVLGCDDRNLRSTNGFATFPLLGAIKGFSSDNAELRPNALNYLYVGGVAQTAPGATPAVVGNSFSTATGDAEASESAIWVVAQSGDVSVRWVNPDGSTPQTSIVYVGGRNVLSIVGDVAAFVRAVEDASVVTLRFEGTAP